MSGGMDQMLASFFGTGGTEPQASAEDAEKVAQAEFFAKTAAANGVNLEQLNEAQIEWLWNRTFSKEAADGGPPPKPEGKDGDDKKKREEEARKEHEEKKASQERFDQATYFGKTAAHAYVAEMKNIIAAGGLEFMKEAGKLDRAVGAVGKHLEGTGKKIVNKIEGGSGAANAMSPRTAKAIGAGAHAAGAAAAAGGAAAAHKALKKEGSASPSAFEITAAELALSKIAAANFDQEQAIARLNAVLTLGLGESEKVASIATYEDALERRSLEYAEAAGYPVEWGQ